MGWLTELRQRPAKLKKQHNLRRARYFKRELDKAQRNAKLAWKHDLRTELHLASERATYCEKQLAYYLARLDSVRD